MLKPTIKNFICSIILLALCVTSLMLYKNNLKKHLPACLPNINTDTTCQAIVGGRGTFFKEIPDLTKITALEIAPYFNALLKGETVKYFDIFDQQQLIELAAEDKDIPTDKIPSIPKMDYVNPMGDMSEIKEKFNLVYSSHNIEHQVDLLKHLNQVANLLENKGEFFLAIPDHRYCFDHFIPATPLSEVLATFWQSPHTYSLQNILAMRCETTHNDSTQHWKGNDGEIKYQHDPECYSKALAEYNKSNGSYVDIHKWRFTPDSFYNIVETTYKMGLQPLRIKKVYCTEVNSHEFYAILYKP
jgi:SAM-dependent methyltransferase